MQDGKRVKCKNPDGSLHTYSLLPSIGFKNLNSAEGNCPEYGVVIMNLSVISRGTEKGKVRLHQPIRLVHQIGGLQVAVVHDAGAEMSAEEVYNTYLSIKGVPQWMLTELRRELRILADLNPDSFEW